MPAALASFRFMATEPLASPLVPPIPPPVDRPFGRPTEDQHQEYERETYQQQSPSSDAANDADRRREPDARSGGQALHLIGVGLAEDHTRAEKSNSGDHALNNPTHSVPVWPLRQVEIETCNDDQRRTEADNSECSNPGWLSVKVTIETDCPANKCGNSEPRQNLQILHRARLSRRSMIRSVLSAYCGLMPAAFASSRFMATESRMSTSNSAGVISMGSPPSALNLACMSGFSLALRIS